MVGMELVQVHELYHVVIDGWSLDEVDCYWTEVGSPHLCRSIPVSWTSLHTGNEPYLIIGRVPLCNMHRLNKPRA